MLIQDATRFLLRHYQIVATWPLQICSSAIVFSPQTSVVRKNNLDKLPAWLRKLPQMEDSWASLMQTLAGHSSWVNAVAFSPDGKQIASGSYDETIKLWDARTGDLQKTLAGHSSWVTAVAFSPDGKQIASGSYDVTIKLWVVANAFKVSRLLGSRLGSHIKFRAWQEIKTFQTVHSLKFSVDGRHLATNLGLIKIESTLDKQSPDFKSLEYLRVQEQWIYYGVVPIFLLPSDFNPQCYDVRGDQVTIGFTNGRVLSFDIDRISLNSIFNNSV
jgi:WD40 repeat protein